jgi:hypothetical protein
MFPPPFGPCIEEVRGRQHSPKHMVKKGGVIEKLLGEHSKNMVNKLEM